jgi:hypothetical protein
MASSDRSPSRSRSPSRVPCRSPSPRAEFYSPSPASRALLAGDAQSPPAAQRPRSLESLLPSQVGLSPIAASQTPRSGQAHPATPPRNFVPVTPITSDHERLLLIFRGANAGASYVIRAAGSRHRTQDSLVHSPCRGNHETITQWEVHWI